jgi:hypothetical protein
MALDTSVFVYKLETNVQYIAFTDHIFSTLERPGSKAVTSTITMTELLVQPYREFNEQRVNEFYALLSTYPNLDWIPPNLEIASCGSDSRFPSLENPRCPAGGHRSVHPGHWLDYERCGFSKGGRH